MKKSFITLAILIILVVQSGLPPAWKNTFVTISALLMIVLVVIPRKEIVPEEKVKKETSFVESSPEVKAAIK